MVRRRQTMSILLLNFFTGPFIIIGGFLLFCSCITYGWYLFGLYCLYIFCDNKVFGAPSSIHRANAWWRGAAIFRHARDYFPVRYAKRDNDVKIDPSKNYLFAYHPHGVMSFGAQIGATSFSGMESMFPGLKLFLQTLNINFFLPVMREHMMRLGVGDASAPTLMKMLRSPGTSVMLVTGGAKESMYAHPRDARVVLKTRQGFVRIAIRTGSALVPVWGFGENNLYENLAVHSSTIRRWQRRIQRAITFTPVLVAGRGVFTYHGGLMPRRRPITVVIGAPIPVGEAEEQPSQERVDQIHAKYLHAVQELYYLYRDIYDPKANDIEFV